MTQGHSLPKAMIMYQEGVATIFKLLTSHFLLGSFFVNGGPA